MKVSEMILQPKLVVSSVNLEVWMIRLVPLVHYSMRDLFSFEKNVILCSLVCTAKSFVSSCFLTVCGHSWSAVDLSPSRVRRGKFSKHFSGQEKPTDRHILFHHVVDWRGTVVDPLVRVRVPSFHFYQWWLCSLLIPSKQEGFQFQMVLEDVRTGW